MPLPTPNLDDLRFQKDLVDEARRRIIRYCPEWTDYNLSDPGITLIELFAWMTELMVYRLNRVPEKNYVKFMELLGIQLEPAHSARAALTFWLSAPFPLEPGDETTTVVPEGLEVSTWGSAQEDEIVFTTDEKLVISPPRLTQLRRQADLNRNYLPRLGVRKFYTFNRGQPQIGDTFYIGFDAEDNIGGYVLQLAFECEETQATGVRREDPPLVWACSMGDGVWREIAPSTGVGEKDTTGGLNNAEGKMVFYLPMEMRVDYVHGREAYWISCRLESRRRGQGMYTQSPRITGLRALSLGATTWATHAQVVTGEVLGDSNGEPGQVFRLEFAPILPFKEGETVEIEAERDGEIVFVAWERVTDFSQSDRYDRHYLLDEASGEVRFGPSIRQADGTVRQYGRIPEAGRQIRVTRYRHGGGVIGNVSANKLQVMHSAVPYIDHVTNLSPARGGLDQETLAEAKMRARREIRSQGRAVTAEDFETLTRRASRAVARVRCNTPGGPESSLQPGMIDLLVVPAVYDALRGGDLSSLTVDNELEQTIRNYLDKYRLFSTVLDVREPDYLGVKVYARIVRSEYHAPEVVVARVKMLLRHFITPLPLETQEKYIDDVLGPTWKGWPFGRDLFVAELFSLIQQVPGVKHVLEVQVGYRAVIPSREVQDVEWEPEPEEDEQEAEEAEAQPQEEEEVDQVQQVALTEDKVIHVPADALLCSLIHEIELEEL